MTVQIPTQPGTSEPPGGPDAPGGTPYPDIADTSHATAAAAAFFRSFFTAKTGKDIEATHAHFHPGKTVYFDATLGWALTANADVRNMWEQYMPRWPAGAKSYPTRILGDMTSAVVFVTDTPELFGGEIRTISIADLEDGKIVRLVDYWDGRGFGAELAGSLRVPADSYPHDLGVSTVTSRPGPVAAAARELTAAFAAGDADRAGELFSYDAVFEDMALRTQLRGQAAIVRYLRRALPALPYARASVRHVAGAGQGGGYEWRADGQRVAVGAAPLRLGAGTVVTSQDLPALTERLLEPDQQGYDVILDTLWGPVIPAAIGAAATGARVVHLGNSAGALATLAGPAIRKNGVSILTYAIFTSPARDRSDAFARLAQHAAAGELTVEYRGTALETLPAIWDDFAAGRAKTRIIVTPNQATPS
jgi:ketosteroid isomerase-like protein